jgi:hypothetical protein
MISIFLYYSYCCEIQLLVHNKIWSFRNSRFYTISRLTWPYTVYEYHMNCVHCLHRIDSNSIILHLLYFCWMCHLWKHNGHCVAMTIFGALCRHMGDKLVWLQCHYTNMQQEQSFSKVTRVQENLRIKSGCSSVDHFTYENTIVNALQWPCFGVVCRHARDKLVWLIVALLLTCNRNKTLVKLHGAWENHVLYECSHASANWEYAFGYQTQPFPTADRRESPLLG